MQINNEQLQAYHADGQKPVLVEYWAPWCVYCRRIAPVLGKITDQYADMLVVGQVNIDDEPQLASKEQIEVIPTLVLYQNGQALGSIVAPESKAAIDQFIQSTLHN
jgi:thioredoxin